MWLDPKKWSADAANISSDVLFSSTLFVTEKLTTLLLIFCTYSINLKMEIEYPTHAHARARSSTSADKHKDVA
jgi:hypothetical protein